MSRIRRFGAQIILNGHEYVTCEAQAAGVGLAKGGTVALVGVRVPQCAVGTGEVGQHESAVPCTLRWRRM